MGDAETRGGESDGEREFVESRRWCPTANIVFGGSGANRTVTVTPAANQNGTATITVTVSDGALTASDTFRADGRRGERRADDQRHCEPDAQREVRRHGADQLHGGGRGDAGGESDGEREFVESRRWCPTANIVFGGSGANRTVTVTPAAEQTGTATITVTVSDGALTASDTFRADGQRALRWVGGGVWIQ